MARVVADESGARFVKLSAVSAGAADVRDAIQVRGTPRPRHGANGDLHRREHRFSKAQQDALLQAVEDAIVSLIGASTENPYFEVISALLSRCQLYRFEALLPEQVEHIVRAALDDGERGLSHRQVQLEEGGLALLAEAAHGDARVALNALETAVE